MHFIKIFVSIAFFFLGIFTTVAAHNSGNHNWKYSTKNLSSQEIYLALDGVPYLHDEFPQGSTTRFTFDQVDGYRYRYGKAFPKIAMRVTEKKTGGTVVLNYDNLLEDKESSGTSPEEAARLSASLTVGEPLKVNERYTWEIIITEVTGKGRISLKYDFKVVPAEDLSPTTIGNAFTFDTDGLQLQQVLLEIGGRPYPTTDLPEQATVEMVFHEVEGFTVNRGRIYPGLAIRVTDRYGKVILREKDLFAHFDRSGLTPKKAERLVSSLTIGHPMQVGQTYTWEVHIWDKIWPKNSVGAKLDFEVLQ